MGIMGLWDYLQETALFAILMHATPSAFGSLRQPHLESITTTHPTRVTIAFKTKQYKRMVWLLLFSCSVKHEIAR